MQRTNILSIIDGHARQPDRLFCRFQADGRSEDITYADLHARSAPFARAFQAAGVGPGEVVMIVLPHRPELFYSFFGAMRLGALPSFMPFPSAKQDHSVFWSSHRKLLELTGIRTILTYRAIEAGLAQHFDGLGVRVLFVEDTDPLQQDGGDLPEAGCDVNAAAFLQHSSGTTGLKKGIILSHHAVLRQVETYAGAIGFGVDDVMVAWLPLYHDMGLIACLMMTAITGATLVLLDPFEWVRRPTTLLDAIDQHHGTFTFLPNFAFLHIARAAQGMTDSKQAMWDLSSLRGAVNCSEPCKIESFERFSLALVGTGLRPEALQVCYAMAENVFAVSQTLPGTRPRWLEVDAEQLEVGSRVVPATPGRSGRVVLSCGAPLPGTSIRIVDEARVKLGQGQAGEIAISSSCLFDGYNELPDLTASKLVDGWYYTGDLGFIDEGELFVLGRQDDLMIIYGRNYYAHTVEQVVTDCPGIAPGRVVAFAVDNPKMGTREAVVLLEPNGTHDAAELRRTAKARILDVLGLSVQHVEIVERNSLVKSTAGKISREHNRRVFLERRSSHV